MVNVHEVKDIAYLLLAECELMIINVVVTRSNVQRNVQDIVCIFRAKIVDVFAHTIKLHIK